MQITYDDQDVEYDSPLYTYDGNIAPDHVLLVAKSTFIRLESPRPFARLETARPFARISSQF